MRLLMRSLCSNLLLKNMARVGFLNGIIPASSPNYRNPLLELSMVMSNMVTACFCFFPLKAKGKWHKQLDCSRMTYIMWKGLHVKDTQLQTKKAVCHLHGSAGGSCTRARQNPENKTRVLTTLCNIPCTVDERSKQT